MWSGGISARNPVRPAGSGNTGLTCQTDNTPPAILQLVVLLFFSVSSIYHSLQNAIVLLHIPDSK